MVSTASRAIARACRRKRARPAAVTQCNALVLEQDAVGTFAPAAARLLLSGAGLGLFVCHHELAGKETDPSTPCNNGVQKPAACIFCNSLPVRTLTTPTEKGHAGYSSCTDPRAGRMLGGGFHPHLRSPVPQGSAAPSQPKLPGCAPAVVEPRLPLCLSSLARSEVSNKPRGAPMPHKCTNKGTAGSGICPHTVFLDDSTPWTLQSHRRREVRSTVPFSRSNLAFFPTNTLCCLARLAPALCPALPADTRHITTSQPAKQTRILASSCLSTTAAGGSRGELSIAQATELPARSMIVSPKSP